MKFALLKVLLITTSCCATGCAYLTPPFEHPIIEQHAQERINTFGVIPSRRMVLIKKAPKQDDRDTLICAEAPADVTDNLAAQLAASFSISAAPPVTGDKAVDASAGVQRALNTYAQFLFKRTQGIQLFRDRSYHLCQARMNGFLTDAQYLEQTTQLMTDVKELIKLEIPNLQNTQPSNQAVAIVPGAVATSSSAGSANASAGAASSPARAASAP